MYRFHQGPKQDEIRNNELHDAILARDSARCIELIGTMDETKLNQPSLGNTPAMLAIKTGLIDVVDALISSLKIDINHYDNKGFSLLHYACFLRETALIQKLIDLDAVCYKIDDVCEWPHPGVGFRRSLIKGTLPHRLYRLPAFSSIPSEIIDSHGFTTFPLIMTNLLFHLDKLSLNYGLKQSDDFDDADHMIRDSNRFVEYANIGMESFLTTRNEKEVDPDVLTLLEQTYELHQQLSKEMGLTI
jgi:ankyrin repeat protein